MNASAADSLYVPLSHLVRWEPIARATDEAAKSGMNPLGLILALVLLVGLLVGLLVLAGTKK